MFNNKSQQLFLTSKNVSIAFVFGDKKYHTIAALKSKHIFTIQFYPLYSLQYNIGMLSTPFRLLLYLCTLFTSIYASKAFKAHPTLTKLYKVGIPLSCLETNYAT